MEHLALAMMAAAAARGLRKIKCRDRAMAESGPMDPTGRSR
jgi:hypothetical protein